jgi:hypothetical protein
MVFAVLALVGTGAYVIHKKHSEKKKARKLAMMNLQLQQPTASRSTESVYSVHEETEPPQYSNREQQPPVYRETPNAANGYTVEKAAMQQSTQPPKYY